MSDAIYYSSEGDTLDFICWKQYQQQAGAVEAVLLSNPGLADVGPIIPINTRIVLPELSSPVTEAEPIRLWD
jgi:phage tail protein X